MAPLRFFAGCLASLVLACSLLAAEPASEAKASAADNAGHDKRMQWFREAKFGMFIHWGLYAIPARGEWVMNKEKIPVAKYAKLAGQFNPVKFDADAWVRVAKDAGMKYIVITSKHHDGFAMFGSKATPYNIVDATPFKRDPLKELAEACRKQHIALGFYYSQAQDWHHPGGATARGSWDPAQKGDFDNYLSKIAVPQIKELLTNYGPVAILWCDTPMQMTRERGELVAGAAQAAQPSTLLNSRLMQHGRDVSSLGSTQLDELRAVGVDYLSYADRQIPARPQWPDWETCMTLNQSWGFTAKDDHWKTSDLLIRHLVEVASKGGNYLLNVGPTAAGEIPAPSVTMLRQVGDWLKVNGESIYGAGRSPFEEKVAAEPARAAKRGKGRNAAAAEPNAAWRCTTKPGKLYFHLLEWPASGTFDVPQIQGGAKSAYLLADKAHTALRLIQKGAALSIELPAKAPDAVDSVLCVELAAR